MVGDGFGFGLIIYDRYKCGSILLGFKLVNFMVMYKFISLLWLIQCSKLFLKKEKNDQT